LKLTTEIHETSPGLSAITELVLAFCRFCERMISPGTLASEIDL